MSNITEFKPTTANQHMSVNMSYTLGDSLPVLCTVLGHQPVFYFDHDERENEQEQTENDVNMLEHFQADLNEEMRDAEKFSTDFVYDTDNYIRVFEEAKASITGQAPCAAPSAQNTQEILDILSKSRLAQTYLDHGAKYDLDIILDDTVHNSLYDRAHNQIRISAHICRAEQILLTLAELRRHWQHRNGTLLNPLHFDAESAVLINRVQKADVISSVIRCAWELQLAGYKRAWEDVENSSYQDLARAFLREVYGNFRNINNGMGMTAVFEAWFLSERCRRADKLLIRQMLNDHQGFVFDVDHTPNSVTSSLLAALGAMPFGKNYLAPHAQIVLNDPIFTELRDRSSANFLWFIKFERSFRETEHDLQTEFSSAASGSTSAFNDISQDGIDAQNVVTLYSEFSQPVEHAPRSVAGGCNEPTGTVIYLRSEPNGRELS